MNDFRQEPQPDIKEPWLEIENEAHEIRGLSAHGFDIGRASSLFSAKGILEGRLRLGGEAEAIQIKFRARPKGIDGYRCTLVDLSLDTQDAINLALKNQNIENPSEFENLSYDELAEGGKPTADAADQPELKEEGPPKKGRRGAVAAIICALGITAALVFIGTIVLGRSSLDVHNGALVGNYLPMSAVEAGTIGEIFVKSGDRVEKGTPLFKVSSREQSLQMETLRSELASAVDQFNAQDRQLQAFVERMKISTLAVEKDIEIAEAELEQVEVELKHAKGLASNLAPLLQRKAISRIEYQDAVATRDSLEQQVRVKNASVERLRVSLDAIVNNRMTIGGDGQFDNRANEMAMKRDLAEAAVKEARRNIEYHNLQLADQTVLATANGLVYSTYRSTGEFVKAGDPIVSLSLEETNWAIGHITPHDALRVRPGQKVYIDIPSLDIETKGTILSVGHRGVYSAGGGWSNDFRSDPINIPIKVSLPEETSQFPSGLRLKMSVALERRWPWESKQIDFYPTTPDPITSDQPSIIATKQ